MKRASWTQFKGISFELVTAKMKEYYLNFSFNNILV